MDNTPEISPQDPQNPAPQSPFLQPPADPGNTPDPVDLAQNLQPPNKSRKKLVLIPILILLIAGAVAAWLVLSKPSKEPVSQASTTALTQTQKICYIRLAHLVCADESGKNKVRYDLEQPSGVTAISSMSQSSDGKQYIVYGVTANGSIVWTLDKNLKNAQVITLPNSLTASWPSLTRDGKSILTEAGNIQAVGDADRQIYRYDLSTKKIEKLTSTAFNSNPYETRDGQIVYTRFDSQTNASGGWRPFVMKSDGSRQKALGGIDTAFSVTGTSYDSKYDTVFIYGTTTPNANSTSEILYGKVSDLQNGKAAKVLKFSVSSSSDSVKYIGTGKIIVSTNNAGKIVDLKTGKEIGSVDHYGVPVGVFSSTALSAFAKSEQQTEQPYERIAGLDSAPADLQTFLKSVFDQEDAKCKPDPKDPNTDGLEFMMTVNKVVRNSYAAVAQGCIGGASYYYAKVSGQWVQAAATQEGLDCSTVNKYKIPKELVDACYSGSTDKLTPNTNP